MMTNPCEYDERRVAAAQIFRNIALEMLQATALDLSLQMPVDSDTSSRAQELRKNRAAALQWVSGSKATMSFSMCCDALNVDADTVRQQLQFNPAVLCDRLQDISYSTPKASSDEKQEISSSTSRFTPVRLT